MYQSILLCELLPKLSVAYCSESRWWEFISFVLLSYWCGLYEKIIGRVLHIIDIKRCLVSSPIGQVSRTSGKQSPGFHQKRHNVPSSVCFQKSGKMLCNFSWILGKKIHFDLLKEKCLIQNRYTCSLKEKEMSFPLFFLCKTGGDRYI